MKKIYPIILFPFVHFLGCTLLTSNMPTQNVLLFKDKDGIYKFDFKTKTESLVLKVSKQGIFLNEPHVFKQDTLIVGFHGKHFEYDIMEEIKRETYTKKYVSVNLNNGQNWVSKTVRYEVYRSGTLEITTDIYDALEKKQSTSQERVKYEGEIRHYNGIDYGKNREREFYWESALGGRTVFSDMGNLFMASGKDTVLLAEMEGRFNPKFIGSGYGQPQIHPSGEYVICNYSQGGLKTQAAYLVKIDLTTKEITTIKEGYFFHPKFSDDGNFVLFKRNFRQGDVDYTWIYDIYWLNLKTNAEHKIGEANNASWIE